MEINMERVVTGLRFIAENRKLSTNALVDGLEKLGCNWTIDDLYAQFDEEPQIGLLEGMRRGDIRYGASVIINICSRSDLKRAYCDERLLSVDDDMSIYAFVRRVTGDDSFTKENIERKKKHD